MANKQFETIGQLAVGIAHDFNNNVVAIIGSAELMKEDFRANRTTPELVDDILLSAQRAAQLTRQLLVYSRKAKMVLTPTDVHQLIDHTVALLRRSIDPKIEVVTHLAAKDACVLADRTLLDNALLNLLVNARDAMPKGGKLTVATSSYEVITGSREYRRGLSPGTYILVEVLDEGEGIAHEVLPNIFEPFF
jgi:signal transduction histidine kinase